METKREEARLRAAAAKARRQAEADARIRAREESAREHANEAIEARPQSRAGRRDRQQAQAAEDDAERSVIPWLRSLGCTLERARHGAELCAQMPDAPLEDRLKVALRGLSAHLGHRLSPGAMSPA
jgi:hypothetical protein